MADIRLAKTVTGDFVIGENDPDRKGIKDAAIVQIVPSGSGSLSIALLPFGFPFEDEIKGFLKEETLIYEIEKIPEELQNKYTEARTDIRIASSGAPEGGKIIL